MNPQPRIKLVSIRFKLRLALATLVAPIAVLALAGCSHGGATAPTTPPAPAPVSTTINKAEQTSTTPDAALIRLKAGNQRFVSGESIRRDYPAQVKASSTGQYPPAVILSCMDSRTAPELLFDQGLGDLFVLRIAGNYAQADILGSLEYATKVSGGKLIVVVGHSDCGAIKGVCDDVKLGNLTTVMEALHPAVDDVKQVEGDRTSKNKKFVRLVTEANIRRAIARIRTDSQIMREMERAGELEIVGAMQDIGTGEVTFFDHEHVEVHPH